MLKSRSVAYLLILMSFIRCQKHPEPIASNSIVNNWQLLKFTSNQHYSNSDHVNNLYALPGDYLNFRGNNKLYSQLFGYRDTVNFQLIDNSTLILSGFDTLQIKSMSPNVLTLYSKVNINRDAFYEKTYYLQK